MQESYITQAELKLLQTSGLNREAPYLISGVSTSQLSIARHYGGCKAFGYDYFYNPGTDELIRRDVVKWIGKERKRIGKEKVKNAGAKQMVLF